MQRWISNYSRILTAAAAISIVVAIGVIGWVVPVRDLSHLVQVWVNRAGPWAAAVYAGAYVLMSILSIPVWPMPFLAGSVFGTAWGTVLASTSCITAAALCFGLARRFRESGFTKSLRHSAKMRALQRVIKSANWKVVAAVRLSHFMTFGMQNYAFGLSKISFLTFLVTTWIVTLPGTLLQAYVGHLGFTSIESARAGAPEWEVWTIRIVGLVVIGLAVGYLGSLGRRFYHDTVEGRLTHALESETARGADARKAGTATLTVVLLTVSVVIGIVAVWSVVKRDRIREKVTQWTMTASVAQIER